MYSPHLVFEHEAHGGDREDGAEVACPQQAPDRGGVRDEPGGHRAGRGVALQQVEFERKQNFVKTGFSRHRCEG